ncbi:hypothetical protein [Mycobacteroides abscessus]|uniref:hypothetical protein n=1 Tax=Mycobacteroides abscessus TaxID=36809 RepID=UPI0009D5E03B|nr:hypothetical protein [Mycobacteroides abscessus]SKF90557.1 Uncharacterised protein [Mycobacteroides abscessus subsp. bolletii]SKG25588.1 Uncharacterised protein [Mycobacteroides abscessus subsp. bolletii]SKH27858.1 Uncharacterised protein [Mycobacteroides abscessus subsp. bolletii]SKH59236.1 Uncharacterised protein [Mycobacteroides abscessus subsp. bolletii]SKH90851.1 Uncharacterised protein [Mycobacteroides abscessus subsp. bolletii]
MATRRTAHRPAGAPHMRVVTEGERAPEPAPLAPVVTSEAPPAPPAPVEGKTLLEAMAGGNYQEILEAQARDIIRDLGGASGAAKAALHGRLTAISKEIEAIKVATPGSGASVVAATSDEPWDPEAI